MYCSYELKNLKYLKIGFLEGELVLIEKLEISWYVLTLQLSLYVNAGVLEMGCGLTLLGLLERYMLFRKWSFGDGVKRP